MERLSIAALAAASGTTSDEIQELTSLGLLDPPDTVGYAATAIARVRLLLGFRSIGVPLEVVAEGTRSGAFGLGFIDELMPEPTALLPESYAAMVATLGLKRTLADAVREVLGTIGTSDADPVRADDRAIFELIRTALTFGGTEEQIARVVRVMANAIQSIVRTQRDFVDEVLIAPGIEKGLTESDVLSRTSNVRRKYRQLGAELMMRLLRRFVDDAIFQSLVELGERALERGGLVPPNPRAVPAIAFADVTGYSRIADAEGDEEAARTAARFAAIVDRTSASCRGRLVKLLGDGAMVVFDDAEDAVHWGIAIADSVNEEGLPPVHVGIDAGQFIRRDGDYFGSVVNVASRLANRAGPHEVLVTQSAADIIDAWEGIAFDELGLVTMKNIAKPIRVLRARANVVLTG